LGLAISLKSNRLPQYPIVGAMWRGPDGQSELLIPRALWFLAFCGISRPTLFGFFKPSPTDRFAFLEAVTFR
jgi:hypothetical protein